MESLFDFLKASQARHSHLCPRQVLGVRIALAGLGILGMDTTKRSKNVLVISETDGCFVDGIEVTAQVSVGHRSLRIEDYGKLAATFVDLRTHQAVRLHPTPFIRELARKYSSEAKTTYFAQLQAYQTMTDRELLSVESVVLDRDLHQKVGSPRQRAHCIQCGEEIINGHEVLSSEMTMCVACAGNAYYREKKDIREWNGVSLSRRPLDNFAGDH